MDEIVDHVSSDVSAVAALGPRIAFILLEDGEQHTLATARTRHTPRVGEVVFFRSDQAFKVVDVVHYPTSTLPSADLCMSQLVYISPIDPNSDHQIVISHLEELEKP